jgi:hypothetical protein
MGVYYPFTDPDAFLYEPTGISTQFTGSYNPNEAASFDNGLNITGISTFSGDVTIDAGTSTTLTIKCDDTGQAGIRLYGNTQGTGYVEVGQSSSYGGGMSYNGDGTPGFVSGETADRITFYGLNAGTRTEVFYYAYNSTGNVNFNGTVSANALDLADNKILRFGTGDDAEFFCNGSHFYLDLNSGIGNFYIRDGTTTRFTFNDNGDFTATGNVTAYSDITLKKDIEVISNALEKVAQIRGVTYRRIDQKTLRQSGVIAQEVEKVLPEVVQENDEGIKSVAYGNMVGLLIEAIKDLKGEVETLKDEIKSLKNENS